MSRSSLEKKSIPPGAQDGLGRLLMRAMSLHNIEPVMALTLLIVRFAATVNAALLALDGRLHARG